MAQLMLKNMTEEEGEWIVEEDCADGGDEEDGSYDSSFIDDTNLDDNLDEVAQFLMMFKRANGGSAFNQVQLKRRRFQ